MKTITHVTAGLWKNTGGPAESVPKLLKELSKQNKFKINLVTLEGNISDNVKELYDYKNIKIHFVKLNSDKNIYFNPGYIKVLKTIIKKSDIVHIQGMWLFPFWLAGYYTKKYNKKLVISPRGCVAPNRLLKSKLKKKIATFLFDKKNLNNADLIHATSELEKDNVKKYGVETESFVIPNGVDFIDTDKYTQKLIKSNKKICLFLARLDPIKGLDILIESWGNVKNKGWLLVICGPDEKEYKKVLEDSIKSKGLENDVLLIDPVFGDVKYNLYTQASLFVLPSYGENFGISIAESLSCGVPVITTNKTPWEDINSYNCGWYIDSTRKALDEAFEEALNIDATLLISKGKNGVKLIKEKYGWKEIANRITETYNRLLLSQLS